MTNVLVQFGVGLDDSYGSNYSDYDWRQSGPKHRSDPKQNPCKEVSITQVQGSSFLSVY